MLKAAPAFGTLALRSSRLQGKGCKKAFAPTLHKKKKDFLVHNTNFARLIQVPFYSPPFESTMCCPCQLPACMQSLPDGSTLPVPAGARGHPQGPVHARSLLQEQIPPKTPSSKSTEAAPFCTGTETQPHIGATPRGLQQFGRSLTGKGCAAKRCFEKPKNDLEKETDLTRGKQLHCQDSRGLADWMHNSASAQAVVPAAKFFKEKHTELALNDAGEWPGPAEPTLYPNTCTSLLQTEEQAVYTYIYIYVCIFCRDKEKKCFS